MKKVAVLLASFNGGNFISEQLSSIFSQIDVDVTVFARDDGSTDQTEVILDIYSKNYKLIRVKNSENTGGPSANFLKLISSIDISLYDFIALSDQDDIWRPEKLISAIKYMDDRKAIGYSSNLLAFNDETNNIWCVNKCSKQKLFDYIFQGASAGCTYVMKPVVIELVLCLLGKNANNFPKKYSHDWIIYAICRSHGLKWVHDNRMFIMYRQHNLNAFGALPGLKGLWSRFKMARVGWYRENIIWNTQFLIGSDDERIIFNAIKRLNAKDKLFLVFNMFKFRRKIKDAFLLSLIIIFGFF